MKPAYKHFISAMMKIPETSLDTTSGTSVTTAKPQQWCNYIKNIRNTKLRLIYRLVCLISLLMSSLLASAQPYEQSTITDNSINFMTARLGDRDQGKGIIPEFAAQNIHYAYSGNKLKPGIIFIHGTPGGWGAFERYLTNRKLQSDYFMVSVDRLGWGRSPMLAPELIVNNSSDDDTKTSISLKKSAGNFSLQAHAIAAIMNQYPDKKWLLVGHSLGASIAPKIAVIEEQKVRGLLLLAGSLNPKLGKPRWYNRFASTMVVKWMISDSLGYSNDEIMALRKQLKVMENEIMAQPLNTDVVVMQGMKDKLVSPKNSAYASKAWQGKFASVRTIELPEAGHFLPWEQTPLVISTIREFD